MPPHDLARELIAVDIGNSRIKIGLFSFASDTLVDSTLPEPAETLELPLANRAGEFDESRLVAWCDKHVGAAASWLVSAVHRGAAETFTDVIKAMASSRRAGWQLRGLTYRDVPIDIAVELPERVGIDRLVGACAAAQLRHPEGTAIVVDVGTAITVDLVTAAGAFAGGAILPGLSMSARALEEQTDALPHVAVERWQSPPLPLGKGTVPAIESGLFWGAVGAIRELVGHFSSGLESPPDVFITGGSGRLIAEHLQKLGTAKVLYVAHLVLSGIALAHRANAAKN